MKYAVQLYNFRRELAQDFKGTLKKIAELGFDGVEFACDYGNIPPQELTDYLKSIDIECAGTMFAPEQLTDPDNKAWEYAEKLNSPAVTISYRTDFVKDYNDVCKLLSDIAANAAARGKFFTYHNHWWEFDRFDGMTVLEHIIEENISNFYLETDVCWLTAGGVDAADFIRKYSKYIKQVHFKDILNPADNLTTTELGRGVIDLQGAVKAIKQSDVECIIYEQDFSENPFDSAVKSLEYLKKL